MNRRAMAAAVALLAAWPVAVEAERVVRYDVDEITAAHDAAEQGLPLTPLPQRGTIHIAVRIAPVVDHVVTRAGISCSAWTVRNPMTLLLDRFLTARDRDSAPATAGGGTAALLVSVDRAATLTRCFATGELKSKCVTRVTIDGGTTRPGAAAEPFHVEREEATNGVGVCAGLTRGIAMVSREAAAELIRHIDSVVAGRPS